MHRHAPLRAAELLPAREGGLKISPRVGDSKAKYGGLYRLGPFCGCLHTESFLLGVYIRTPEFGNSRVDTRVIGPKTRGTRNHGLRLVFLWSSGAVQQQGELC